MKIRVFLLALALCLLPLKNAQAVMLLPDVDGAIFSFGFINDYEFTQVLNETRGGTSSFETRAIWEFNLSSITQPVDSAVLHLDVAATKGPYPYTIDLHSYSGDGAITSADYNAGTVVKSFLYNAEPSVDVDLTSALQNAQGSHHAYFGLNGRMENVAVGLTDPSPYVAFNSLDYGPSGYLQIGFAPTSAVPEPMTWSLFLTGLIGMVPFFRREK